MENKALGRGLSALIPNKDDNNGKDNSDKIEFLKTSLIKNNSLQPRSQYDDSKLDELKSSIKEKGILQPVLIREKDGEFEVIAGERRLRAARELKLEEIPVIIKKVSDKEALVISLVENIQREELNPVEEAEAYHMLIEEFKYTQEEVAQSVGKDRSTVTNLLRLLKLPQEIQACLYNGNISVGHARALLSIEPFEDQKRILQDIIRKRLSVRDLENIIKEKKASKELKPVKKSKDRDVQALEEELQVSLGTKVQIFANKKKGRIVIDYYSLNDLDRILKIIKK